MCSLYCRLRALAAVGVWRTQVKRHRAGSHGPYTRTRGRSCPTLVELPAAGLFLRLSRSDHAPMSVVSMSRALMLTCLLLFASCLLASWQGLRVCTPRAERTDWRSRCRLSGSPFADRWRAYQGLEQWGGLRVSGFTTICQLRDYAGVDQPMR